MGKNRHIKTDLPGPKAKALMERDRAVVSPSYMREYPFVIDHGRGAELWDVDGNRFIDFMAGIAVCSTGHAHSDVVAAINEAAHRFLHISCDYWHEYAVELAETMNELGAVSGPAMTFFANSGTESVEGAIKLARYVTGRPRIIAFLGGFHGRTMGALSLTSSKVTQQERFFPTMPGVVHVPYPNNYRPVLAGADQGQAVLAYIERLLDYNIPASEVAAVIVEPIQGEGGYIVPPDGFLAGLKALCERHDILLIFDEVQSGIGRTGKMFACQHAGVTPDIMTLAKGLASGMPIGLVVARKEVMERWEVGAHANTFGGNPVCCAAALATLKLVRNEYMANTRRVGEHFIGRLRDMMDRFECIGEVRGRGLMIGMELVTDRVSKKPARALARKVVNQAYRNGLLLLTCGLSTVRFVPPLPISTELVDEGIDVLEKSLSEVEAALG